MPAGDGIAANPADLVAHARHLDGIADALAVARQAGRSTRLDADAYGHLCLVVPVLLGEVRRVLIDGIDSAGGSVHDTADRLRDVSAHYRESDSRAEAALDRIRRRT